MLARRTSNMAAGRINKIHKQDKQAATQAGKIITLLAGKRSNASSKKKQFGKEKGRKLYKYKELTSNTNSNTNKQHKQQCKLATQARVGG